MKKITEQKLVEQTTDRLTKMLKDYELKQDTQVKLNQNNKKDKTDYSLLMLDIDDAGQQFEELASEMLNLLNVLIEIKEKQPEIKSLIGVKRRVDRKMNDFDLLLSEIEKAGSSRVITIGPELAKWIRLIRKTK